MNPLIALLRGSSYTLPIWSALNYTNNSNSVAKVREVDEYEALRFAINRYHLCANFGKPPKKSDKRLFVKSNYPRGFLLQSLTFLNKLTKCDVKNRVSTKARDCYSSANYRDYYMDDATLECFYTKRSKHLNKLRMSDFDFTVTASASVDLAIKGVTLRGLDTIHARTGKFDPRFLKSLKAVGLIRSRTFSVWLNSWQSSRGEILIEGLDPSKVDSDIYTFPLVESLSGNKNAYAIKMNAIFIVDRKNRKYCLAETSFPVVFDPSVSISRMPYNILKQFYDLIGVRSTQEDYFVPCENVAHGGGIGLSFSGVEVVFPFSDIMVPMNMMKDYCVPGFWPGEVPVIGDNLMHGLYVVYDPEENRLGIAVAKTESLDESVRETYIIHGDFGTHAPLYSASQCWNLYNVRYLAHERIRSYSDFVLRPRRRVRTHTTHRSSSTAKTKDTTSKEEFNSYLFNIDVSFTLGNGRVEGIKPTYIPHYIPKITQTHLFNL